MPHLAILGLAASGIFGVVEITTTMIAMAVLGDVMLAVNYLTFQNASNGQSSLKANGHLITTQSADACVPVIYGRHKVAGNRVFTSESGPNNWELNLVETLSEGEIEGVEQIYLDDRPITDFSAAYEVFNGSANQGLCTSLQDRCSGWLDYMRHTAYVYVRIAYDANKFSSVPRVEYIVKGVKLYDPRNGITAYSDNPALVWYDIMTNRRYGLGISSTAIDINSVIDAANWCDTNTYTFNGALKDRKAFIDVLTEVMANFRGDVIWSGGQFKLIIRKYDTPVMSFSEDNDIVADSFSISVPGISDTPNRIKFSYPDEDFDWVTTDQVLEDSNSVLIYDLEERDMEMQLIGTTNLTQATNLATYFLERTRLNKTFSFTVFPKALALEPGDMIQVTHSVPGWIGANANTIVRVVDVAIAQDGLVNLTVQQESANLYDNALNVSPHTFFQSSLPNPFASVSEVTGVSITEEEYYNKDVSYTRLRVTFSRPASTFYDYSEVWIDDGFSGGFVHHTDTTGSFTIEPVREGITYTIKLVSVSVNKIKQDIATVTAHTHYVNGKQTAPNDVANFRAIPQSDTIILVWDAVSNIDLLGYEIRKGTSWNGGIFIGFTRAISFHLNGVSPGSHSFMIKSVDTNGKYSSNYALVSTTVYGPASYTEKMSELNQFQNPSTWVPSTAYSLGNKVTIPMIYNGDLELWTNGTNVAPDKWSLTGDGSVARESTNVHDGTYSAALTYGTANTDIRQTIPGHTLFAGKKVSVGVWVKTSVASQARIGLYDGAEVASSYHTGGGGWEFLTVTKTFSATPTGFIVILRVNAAGIAYFDKVIIKVLDHVESTYTTDLHPYYYKCTVAGTSGTIPPTWPTVNGSTVADNTATWEALLNQVFNNIETYNDAQAGWEIYAVHSGDEFEAATQQNFVTGGDGVKRHGWQVMNTASADAITSNTTNSGKLTIDCNAVDSQIGLSTFNAPFVFKDMTGDFDVETYVSSSNHNGNYESAWLVARDPNASAGEDIVGVSIMYHSGYTPTAWYSRSTANSVNTDSMGVATHPYLRLNRAGNVFTTYTKALATDTWTQRSQTTRNDFAATIQVGLAAASWNTSNSYVAQFEYFRKTGGVLSGVYESPVYDRGSLTTRRSWPQFDYLFEGTGTAWYDQFSNTDTAIDQWTDRFSSTDTWLHLFGSYNPGSLRMEFGFSSDGITWNWVKDWESFTTETQSRYVKYKVFIDDADNGGYTHCRAITLKEAYWV